MAIKKIIENGTDTLLGCDKIWDLAIEKSFHQGQRSFSYFWQDSRGKEIDCLQVEGEASTPVETKSGKTMSNSYFENLKYWRQLSGLAEEKGYVVYGGDQSMQTSLGELVRWKEVDRIMASKT